LSPLAIGGTTVAAGLLLVPFGLVPVAVFPPYEKPRTIPSVSVIFAEDPNIMRINDDITLMRTRRALVNQMKSVLPRNYQRPSLFSTLWNFLLDKFRYGRKKIKIIKDEIKCIRTKIEFIKMKIKQKIRENRQGNRVTSTTTSTTENVVYRITTETPYFYKTNSALQKENSEEINEIESPSISEYITNESQSSYINIDKSVSSESGSFNPPSKIDEFSPTEGIKDS